jgi:enamine deaminase RidA (YjgF/YER057c/UK114 family)
MPTEQPIRTRVFSMTIHDLGVPAEPSPHVRLKRLGIVVPPPPPPVGNFLTHVQEGKLLFLSGQGPREPDAEKASRTA